MSANDMKMHSETNWAKVDALTDDTIDTSDIPALTDAQLSSMTLRVPGQSTSVTVRVDADVLAWFKAQGEDFQQQVNEALRMYVAAHRETNT